MKIKNELVNIIRKVLVVILFICASLFMHNFYKLIVSFITNQFNDMSLVLPMIVSYLLAAVSFIIFFINYFLKKLSKVGQVIYSLIVIVVAILSLVGIFNRFDVYVSNNNYGVYQSLPSIIIHFPYDAIVINSLLIIFQIYHLLLIINPDHKLKFIKDNMYIDYFDMRTKDLPVFIFIVVYSLFVTGDFICGFYSICNVLYDPKYIFLLLWILMPTINLFLILFRFENKIKDKKNLYFILNISFNVLFIALFVVFELIYPNFVVGVGKPLFPLTYTVSFPVELLVVVVIQFLSILIYIKKIVYNSTIKD